ncbi:ANTAR domain-containing response regulator [Pseudomonas rubra]|uniref:ANTAR domain-containing protein n=1 Tax=Pseudomonas rubra TaxID=2942627 RepID=A0ABT5PC72_9PSED|nr:ANTAR domain-containing protein [Pseudomonas rubra]MDD1015890.1 ANTAR domain-containing protein [Pseudomonas rubra]MDD1040206.1 ANTAR domain-containing protein [Pseudomonas rubra]MDD1157918.1 ANTAR domain-containing protein [Pseudomonas rubra]
MSPTPILSTLRELQVLVINPPGAVSDALVLQLIRIGCSVRQLWPPTQTLEVAVDLIFTGVFQNHHHEVIHALVRTGDPRTTLVALVDYESPAVLSQILELGAHGVITQPLDSHRVLPVLVAARRNSEEAARLKLKNAQLQERLEHQADINRAKVLLMKRHDWEEEQAHGFLSREAMKRRESILTLARELLKQHSGK